MSQSLFAREARCDKINGNGLRAVQSCIGIGVHWQMIPRYRDDAHFPKTIWNQGAEPCQRAPGRGAPDVNRLARALKQRLG